MLLSFLVWFLPVQDKIADPSSHEAGGAGEYDAIK
jgi:hypothetical protein